MHAGQNREKGGEINGLTKVWTSGHAKKKRPGPVVHQAIQDYTCHIQCRYGDQGKAGNKRVHTGLLSK